MAAGDVAAWERTEEPSARRLREARLDGRIARSPDLATACLVLAAAAAATLGGGAAVRALGGYLASSLDPSRPFADEANLAGEVLEGAVAGASIVVPAACGLFAMAWLAGAGQVGLVFTTRPLAPNPARLSPATNLAGLASSRGLRRLATDSVKVAAVALAAWWAIGGDLGGVVGLAALPAGAAAAAGAGTLARIAFAAGGALLAVGLVDWLLERRRVHAELRMTRREAAEDRKEEEGDPAWRRRRADFARGLSASPAVAVRSAAAVVVARDGRATSLAVAIGLQDHGEPRILAFARDAAAGRLVSIASAAGVPTVEDAPLARLLASAGSRAGSPVAGPARGALLEALARVPGIAGRLADDEVTP